MRVYGESNFVLEVALEREEAAACRTLLNEAAAGRISLVVPAVCTFEPYYTIAGNRKRRRELVQQVEVQARELGRTKTFEESSRNIRNMIKVFADSEDAEQTGLSSALTEMLKVSDLIPLTKDVVNRAISDVLPRLGFELPDALVYASVLEHLRTASRDDSCFVTKNSKDFADPDIESELQGLGCKLLFKFEDGLGYLRI